MFDKLRRLLGGSGPEAAAKDPGTPASDEAPVGPSGADAPDDDAGEAPADGDDVLLEARAAVSRDLRMGVSTLDEAVESALEMFAADELPEGAEIRLRAMAEAERDVLRREVEGWPASTDCDRLDAAFAALESVGVVARQDFTCCMTCGSTEIHDQLAAARAEGRSVRGYAFFHRQDMERAAEGEGLMLAYGPGSPGVEPQAIGHEVVAALAKAGLEAAWSGDVNQRIHVKLDWKQRRNAALG